MLSANIAFISGALRAVVTDGITIGHPCCGEHDCKLLLKSQRDWYCPKHQAMGYKRHSAVTDCTQDVKGHHQTCDTPEHRALETRGVESHTAMFQLHRRLECLKIYHAPDETTSIGDEDSLSLFVLGEIIEVKSDAHPSKPERGNTKTRAHFGRHRTHNEELCAATCGIILGQATMYGSEGPNRVCICIVPTMQYLDMLKSWAGFPQGFIPYTELVTRCHLP